MLMLPNVTGRASLSNGDAEPELTAEDLWASTGGRYSDEYSRILDALEVPSSKEGVISNPEGSSLIGSIRQVENEQQVIVSLAKDRDTPEQRESFTSLVALVAPGFQVKFDAPAEYSEADLIALADEIMSQRDTLRGLGVSLYETTAWAAGSTVLVFLDEWDNHVESQQTLSRLFGPVVRVVGPVEDYARQ